jgi:hypothetical protein
MDGISYRYCQNRQKSRWLLLFIKKGAVFLSLKRWVSMLSNRMHPLDSLSSSLNFPLTKKMWSPLFLEKKDILRLVYRLFSCTIVAFLALGEFFWNVACIAKASLYKKVQPIQSLGNSKLLISIGACGIAALVAWGCYYWLNRSLAIEKALPAQDEWTFLKILGRLALITGAAYFLACPSKEE